MKIKIISTGAEAKDTQVFLDDKDISPTVVRLNLDIRSDASNYVTLVLLPSELEIESEAEINKVHIKKDVPSVTEDDRTMEFTEVKEE